MLARVLRRSYQVIPGSRARLIDDFYSHLAWLRQNRPTYAIFYFKNSWNPECSAELQSAYLKAIENNPFEAFVVDGSLGQPGERTKKYYCVKYEPTFLLLVDGMEGKRVIGSDISGLHQAIDKVKLFRANVNWDLGMNRKSVNLWEDYHDEYMKEWRQWTEGETRGWDGTLVFDRT